MFFLETKLRGYHYNDDSGRNRSWKSDSEDRIALNKDITVVNLEVDESMMD